MQQDFFDLFGADMGFGMVDDSKSNKDGKGNAAVKAEKKTSKNKEKSEANTKDFDVDLPLNVLARGFRYEIPAGARSSMKISEVFQLLDDTGYLEVCLPGINCAYDKTENALYITTNNAVADADGTQVEFTEIDEIIIIDGMNKCELSIDNFPGKDEDEVSCLDLSEYWVHVDSRYKGCKMHYNSGVAYPIFQHAISDKEAVSLPVSIMVNGEWHDLSEADFTQNEITVAELKKKFFGMENSAVVPVIYANLDKSAYFLAYSQKKKITAPKGITTTKKTEKKMVEEKYALPLQVFICTFGKNHELSSGDFLGKEKITLTDVRGYFKDIYKIFADDSRKLDAIYLKEENLLSLNFISGKKGRFFDDYEEYENYGKYELIRSTKELKEVIQRPFFFGTLVNYKEYQDSSVQINSFPVGTFLLEKESETQIIKSLTFKYWTVKSSQ